MAPRLASVLTTADFSAAELSALRLDGDVYSVDQCVSPIDEVPSVRLRAAALATVLPERLIVAQRSAAWVWGALDRLPARYEVCADIGARTRPVTSNRLVLREVVIESDEMTSCAGIILTTPIRTATDLARFGEVFADAEVDVIARLMEIGRFDAAACARAMNRRRKLPNKVIALARLGQSEQKLALSRRRKVSKSLVNLGADPIHVVDRIDSPDGVQHTIHVGGVPHFEHEPAESETFA